MRYPIEGDPTNVTVTGTITVSFTSAPPPPLPYLQAAPGLERVEIEVSGCPGLMAWTAEEVGVNQEMLQVWVANSLSSSRDIQPCNACGNLKQAAMVLQDPDGARIAALAQVINQFASSTAPPTEEQMASIADTIARNTGANNEY
ncbi:MAG: hypothetical protein ACYS80_13535, partial [Planctomycetota bacterium]